MISGRFRAVRGRTGSASARFGRIPSLRVSFSFILLLAGFMLAVAGASRTGDTGLAGGSVLSGWAGAVSAHAAQDSAPEGSDTDVTEDAEPASGEDSSAGGDTSASDEPPTVYRATGPVLRLEVRGPITPAVADYIESGIERAESSGAAALLLVLDTPGGLLTSTRTIVQHLLAAPFPVIVYVSPGGAGAASAGVFLTMAGHIAAMAPGTTIGAAHPVGGQGQDIDGHMGKKVENFTASFSESIAEQRGRNVEWAEKAVRESVAITETEAVENSVVDFVAADVGEILEKADGKVVEIGGERVRLDLSGVERAAGYPVVEELPMTFRQQVLQVISDPNVAYLLMMAGMLGLYVEISNPGLIFPGVAGAISLLLALLAMQVLPISSTGVALIILGLLFLVAELFLPSFGALGVGGLVAMTLGSLFLYTSESALSVDPGAVGTAVGTFGLAFLGVAILLIGDRRRPARTGSEGIVGEHGVVVVALDPVGKIKVRGEIWNARVSGEAAEVAVPAGAKVRVESLDGLEARVIIESSST